VVYNGVGFGGYFWTEGTLFGEFLFCLPGKFFDFPLLLLHPVDLTFEKRTGTGAIVINLGIDCGLESALLHFRLDFSYLVLLSEFLSFGSPSLVLG
jgi:hypothetical protein